MKHLVRLFFRGVRILIGPLMLLWERLTTPRGITRDAAAQAQVDAATRRLALYQFRTCPFCIRVRRVISALSLDIELRDAQHDPDHRRTLLEGGGQVRVPCLRIEDADGKVHWLYESADINRYLESRFA